MGRSGEEARRTNIETNMCAESGRGVGVGRWVGLWEWLWSPLSKADVEGCVGKGMGGPSCESYARPSWVPWPFD